MLLLTNDDGLGEPGLEALARATAELGLDHLVVAPSGPRSSCGHAVTLGQSIRIVAEAGRGIAVEGTPADCVRLGLHHLAGDVEMVLSGINPGGNLGADVFHSGTVAAVREAALHGVPGIAFSHYMARGRRPDWDRAARWARRVLEVLLRREREPGTFWNVNFPHPEADGAPEPELVFCKVDPSPLPLRFDVAGDEARYSGDYHARTRRPGYDVDTCFRGNIAISRMRLFAD